MTRRGTFAAIAAAAVLAAGAAHAQTPADAQAARTHFDRGLQLFEQQNFDGALAEFQRAWEMSRRPSVLYNLGATYQALHRYPEAARALEDYLRQVQDLPPARRAQVERALAEIRALIAYVRVTVTPAGPGGAVTVTVDDEPVTLPPDGVVSVGPGRHTVAATAADAEPAHETFTIASGETRAVALALRPRGGAPAGAGAPAAPAQTASLALRRLPPDARVEVDGRAVDATRPVPVAPGRHRVAVAVPGSDGWSGDLDATAGAARTVDVRVVRASGLAPGYLVTAAAATGVLLVGAAVFGGLTLSTRAELDGYYRDQASQPAVQDLVSRGEGYRLATNVFFGAAALAAIGTVALLPLTRFRGSGRPRVEVGVAPTPGGATAGVGVAF